MNLQSRAKLLNRCGPPRSDVPFAGLQEGSEDRRWCKNDNAAALSPAYEARAPKTSKPIAVSSNVRTRQLSARHEIRTSVTRPAWPLIAAGANRALSRAPSLRAGCEPSEQMSDGNYDVEHKENRRGSILHVPRAFPPLPVQGVRPF